MFNYTEEHYFGNPGYYQTFAFTASSIGAGRVGDVSALGRTSPDEMGGTFTWPDPKERWTKMEQIPGLTQFRLDTVVTTYTVIGASVLADDLPHQFGPHGDEVRTIP